MSRKATILAVLAVLLVGGLMRAQQPDRRRLGAEFRLARGSCRAAADSGSIGKALAQLNRIATQDPNYPGLKALQERCGEEYKKQRNQEDLLFEEAKSAYQGGALEEARVKFQSLANRETAHTAEAKSYLSLIVRAGPAAAAPASQQDYANLKLATQYFKAQNYAKAKPLFEMLLGKGGTLAAEAKKYLDQIDLRSKSNELLRQGMQAFRQRRYQGALDIFQKIQQQDPGYPGLETWISRAYGAMGKTPLPAGDSAALARGKALFAEKKFPAALKTFRELEFSRPDSPEIQDWIQKTQAAIAEEKKRDRLARMVKGARAQLRRKDYLRARTQLRRALVLSPNNKEISNLLAQAEAGMKRSGQTADAADRSAELAAYLENGIREFYGGNFGETTRLLDQYVQENGKHAALAYFYLGALICTEYFLEGEKDGDKQLQARELFAKSRQANEQFEPPREWVSPKIIALYEKAASKP